MPSPFPGMDPYLENTSTWRDLHHSLITYIRDALQPNLRPNYNARIEERVYMVTPPQRFYPDVTLLKMPRALKESRTLSTASPANLREPIELILPKEEQREPFLEIRQRSGEVVAVIEVLSPSNKAHGEGYQQYLRKQNDVLNSQAHLVEIDLLSTGLFATACNVQGARPEDLPPSRYLICVSRAQDRNEARFLMYPIRLQEALPAFRIPLKAPDPDVVLNLQAVFEKCYDNGGYADFVNYKEQPPAPLTEEEGTWVKEMILKV